MLSDSIRDRLRDRGDLVPQAVESVALAEALFELEETSKPSAPRHMDVHPSLAYRAQDDAPPPVGLIAPPIPSGGFAIAARRESRSSASDRTDPSLDLPALPPAPDDAD